MRTFVLSILFAACALAEPPVRNYLPPTPGSYPGAGQSSTGGYPSSPSARPGAPGGGSGGYASGNGGAPAGGDDGSSEPAKYEFSYEVKDAESGNDFGHSESRDGDVTKGKYYVLLPDGRKQIVEYTADQGGYQPKITYEGEANTGGAGGAGGSTGYPSGPGGAGGSTGYPSGPGGAGGSTGYPSGPGDAGGSTGYPSGPGGAGGSTGYPSGAGGAGGSVGSGYPSGPSSNGNDGYRY